MQLSLSALEDNTVLMKASGKISQELLSPELDPFAEFMGQEPYRRCLLLNLQDAEYLDSSGVGMLLRSHKRFQSAGGALILHSIPTIIHNVLKMLRMDLVLHMAKDLRAAQALCAEMSAATAAARAQPESAASGENR